MSNRDLVAIPVTQPAKASRSGLWLVGALALGVALLAPAVYLLANQSIAPGATVATAIPDAEALSAPKAAPVPVPRPTLELKAPSPSQHAGVPVLAPAPPRPGTAAPPASIQGPVPRQGWVLESDASLTTGSVNPGVLVTYFNRDIDGGDYRVLRETGLAECQNRCRAEPRCRAYTFNKWENVCFLKASATVTRIEPRGISGARAVDNVHPARRPATIQKVRSRRFPGQPYKTLERQDYDSCARQCIADPFCLGFNFGKAKRTCGLIASLDKSVADNATDAGMKWQAPIVAASAKRRRGPSPGRNLPPDAADIFDTVFRQILR